MASSSQVRDALSRSVMAGAGKVFGSRFLPSGDIVGENGGEYVIPMKASFRQRALDLLADAAARFGVEAFAGGRQPRKKSWAQRHAERKRRVAAMRRRKARRQRRADRGFIGRHHLGGLGNITAPVERAEEYAEDQEQTWGWAEHKYRTDADSHPVLNDDGSVNTANVSWHTSELDHLISDLMNNVIKAWEEVRKQVDLAQQRIQQMFTALSGWDPKSKWGESRRKDWLEELTTAADSLHDSDRTARGNIGDRWMDVYDLSHERGVIAGTQASKDAGGGGAGGGDGTDFQTQFGAYNDARSQLFSEMGGNALATVAAAGGAGGAAFLAGLGIGVAGGGVGSSGAAATAATSGTAAIAALGGAAPANTPPGQAKKVAGQAGTTVNQTNNFAAPPPDPHTFAQGVKWEIQATV